MKTRDPKSGGAKALPILAIFLPLTLFIAIEAGAFASVEAADSASLDLVLARLDAFEAGIDDRLDDIDSRMSALETQLQLPSLARKTELCWTPIDYSLGVGGEVNFEFNGEAQAEAKAPAAVATGVGGQLNFGGTLTPITASRKLSAGQLSVQTCWEGQLVPVNGIVKTVIEDLFAYLQPPDWSIRDASRAIRRAVRDMKPAEKLAGIAERMESFLNNRPQAPSLEDLVRPRELYAKYIEELGFTTGKALAPSWMENGVKELVAESPALDSLIDGSVNFCNIRAEFGPGIINHACNVLGLDLQPPSLEEIRELVDGVRSKVETIRTWVEDINTRTTTILGNTRNIGDCHRGLGKRIVGAWAAGDCGGWTDDDENSAASQGKPRLKSQ